MSSKSSSIEEKVKLPPTETISRCYQPQQTNRKVIRILTVAVYVLCVSLAAIMLSLYYIFIWDPTIRPFVTKSNNCDKIVIPEKIAIRMLNSSEVTAEQFYKHILEQYRILNQMQQQRQQFLQKQHIQLQQLAAGNRFQEIFATATIIQSNPNDRLKKPITPTNGTFLFEPPTRLLPAARPLTEQLNLNMNGNDDGKLNDLDTVNVPILDTAPPTHLQKRKLHRKHYNHNHRRNQRNHNKKKQNANALDVDDTVGGGGGGGGDGQQQHETSTELQQQQQLQQQPSNIMEMPLNPPTAIVQEPIVYTSMPIPLILSSSEDKRPPHHAHSHSHAHGHGERHSGSWSSQARKRTTMATISGYAGGQTYLNPFLNGELIFEK